MQDVIFLKDVARKLSSMSWKILEILNSEECLTYTDIKSRFKLSQEKLSKEIARLEGGLLIEFKKDYQDERTKPFVITINGINILKIKKGGLDG